MVSSTIYTSHSSSFSTAKIIWRNRISTGFSFYGWLFKYWPFDYHDSGAFRTGLGEASCKLESKQWLIQIGSHTDVDALDAPQVEKQDGYDLVLWRQISTFHEHFFGYITQMDNCRAWMMFVFFFLPLDVFELLSTFPQYNICLYYFFLFSNFGCHCIAILFCMIIAVSKQLFCSIKFCRRRWY